MTAILATLWWRIRSRILHVLHVLAARTTVWAERRLAPSQKAEDNAGPPAHWLALFGDNGQPQWQSFGNVQEPARSSGAPNTPFAIDSWGSDDTVPKPEPGITARIRQSWAPVAESVTRSCLDMPTTAPHPNAVENNDVSENVGEANEAVGTDPQLAIDETPASEATRPTADQPVHDGQAHARTIAPNSLETGTAPQRPSVVPRTAAKEGLPSSRQQHDDVPTFRLPSRPSTEKAPTAKMQLQREQRKPEISPRTTALQRTQSHVISQISDQPNRCEETASIGQGPRSEGPNAGNPEASDHQEITTSLEPMTELAEQAVPEFEPCTERELIPKTSASQPDIPQTTSELSNQAPDEDRAVHLTECQFESPAQAITNHEDSPTQTAYERPVRGAHASQQPSIVPLLVLPGIEAPAPCEDSASTLGSEIQPQGSLVRIRQRPAASKPIVIENSVEPASSSEITPQAPDAPILSVQGERVALTNPDTGAPIGKIPPAPKRPEVSESSEIHVQPVAPPEACSEPSRTNDGESGFQAPPQDLGEESSAYSWEQETSCQQEKVTRKVKQERPIGPPPDAFIAGLKAKLSDNHRKPSSAVDKRRARYDLGHVTPYPFPTMADRKRHEDEQEEIRLAQPPPETALSNPTTPRLLHSDRTSDDSVPNNNLSSTPAVPEQRWPDMPNPSQQAAPDEVWDRREEEGWRSEMEGDRWNE